MTAAALLFAVGPAAVRAFGEGYAFSSPLLAGLASEGIALAAESPLFYSSPCTRTNAVPAAASALGGAALVACCRSPPLTGLTG